MKSEKKMIKQVCLLFLCLCLTVCLIPNVSLASGESSIQLEISELQPNDVVYFGQYTDNDVTYDVPWYVIPNTVLYETSVPSGSNVLSLFSKYSLGYTLFREYGNDGYYAYSTTNLQADDSMLKTVMDGLYNGEGKLFTSIEQDAVMETILDGDSMYLNMSDISAHVFPLSKNEVRSDAFSSTILSTTVIATSGVLSNTSWLRTTYNAVSSFQYVMCNDHSIGEISNDRSEIRPALHLDLDSVLFIAAAKDGKMSGVVGADAMNSNSVPSNTTEWKLTLKDYDGDAEADNDRDGFRVYTTEINGSSYFLHYLGAKTGTNEYLSAMIVDNGIVSYYGRILQLDGNTNAASGIASVNVPTGVTLDGDTKLYVFNEQYNGDYKTDYSSALEQISLTINAPTVSDVTVSGTAYSPITSSDMTLTLTDDSFNALAENDDVSSWITNLPAGLIAKVKTPITAGEKSVVITISGTPTEERAQSMAITIPATAITSGIPITIAANAKAVYSIDSPIPPSVFTQPSNQSVTEGNKATFTVVASGTGLTYQWQKRASSTAAWVDIALATNATYTIDAVAISDNGAQYQCIVKNAVGEVMSDTVTLVVTAVDIPTTGDIATPWLLTGICVLSLAGIAIEAYSVKKRRTHN